jgi:DNA primase
MFYPDEAIQEVRAQNDIIDVVQSYVPLRMRSGRHWGLCPFHQENTPSFCVNGDTQFFHCFGCGAGGNVITFVMRIEHMDFVDALKQLADRVHITLPQPGTADRKQHAERALAAEYNKKAARFFYDQLRADTHEGLKARDYLSKRGINPAMQKMFGLGLSPPGWDGLLRHMTANGEATPADLHNAGLLTRNYKDNDRFYDRFRGRLMFPIIDLGKRVVGFGGRIMPGDSEEAKYINSPESSLFNKGSQLYALNMARKTHAKEFVVVEGYMDVLALFSAGFTNAVGVLGTALTVHHVRLLRRAGCETALLLLDSDIAGTNAAIKSIPLLLDGGLRVKVLQVPDAKDPDEYLQRFGAKKLGQLLANAQSHIVFQVDRLRGEYDMEKTEDRVRFTQEAAALLAPLSSEIETDAYVQETARLSFIAPSAIFAEIKKQRDKAALGGGQAVPQPRRARRGADDPGLREARKALLNLIITHPPIACALADSGCLKPMEMGEEVSSKMLAFVYQNTQNMIDDNGKGFPAPADIVSLFGSVEEQQKASEVFSRQIAYSTVSDMEKSLNDTMRIIKLAYIDKQIEDCHQKKDYNAVNSLGLSKNSLQNQYIYLRDG